MEEKRATTVLQKRLRRIVHGTWGKSACILTLAYVRKKRRSHNNLTNGPSKETIFASFTS